MYKVVRRTSDGSLISVYTSTLTGVSHALVLQYTPNRRTTATVGGITVFRTVSRARCFISCVSGCVEIWRVRCRAQVPLPELRLDGLSVVVPGAAEYLWTTGIPQVGTELIAEWPFSTMAFKHVTLLEQVT